MWEEGGKQAMKITKIMYKNATIKEQKEILGDKL